MDRGRGGRSSVLKGTGLQSRSPQLGAGKRAWRLHSGAFGHHYGDAVEICHHRAVIYERAH